MGATGYYSGTGRGIGAPAHRPSPYLHTLATILYAAAQILYPS